MPVAAGLVNVRLLNVFAPVIGAVPAAVLVNDTLLNASPFPIKLGFGFDNKIEDVSALKIVFEPPPRYEPGIVTEDEPSVIDLLKEPVILKLVAQLTVKLLDLNDPALIIIQGAESADKSVHSPPTPSKFNWLSPTDAIKPIPLVVIVFPTLVALRFILAPLAPVQVLLDAFSKIEP